MEQDKRKIEVDTIKKYWEIKFVMNNGLKTPMQKYIMFSISRELLPSHNKYSTTSILYGIMVGRKFGNAVLRNYAKRKIRLLAAEELNLDVSSVYVFIPRYRLIER